MDFQLHAHVYWYTHVWICTNWVMHFHELNLRSWKQKTLLPPTKSWRELLLYKTTRPNDCHTRDSPRYKLCATFMAETKKDIYTSIKRTKWPIRSNKRVHLKCCLVFERETNDVSKLQRRLSRRYMAFCLSSKVRMRKSCNAATLQLIEYDREGEYMHIGSPWFIQLYRH